MSLLSREMGDDCPGQAQGESQRQHLVRLEDVSIEVPGTYGLESGLGKSGWVLLGKEYTGETWGSLRETRLHLPAHSPLTTAID